MGTYLHILYLVEEEEQKRAIKIIKVIELEMDTNQIMN